VDSRCGNAANVRRRWNSAVRRRREHHDITEVPEAAGCDLNIEKAMPSNSRLTVWVVFADGSTLRHITKRQRRAATVTAQHVHQVPVNAKPEVLDRLRPAADEMSTSEVTAYAHPRRDPAHRRPVVGTTHPVRI
jgi:hypothetical protein